MNSVLKNFLFAIFLGTSFFSVMNLALAQGDVGDGGFTIPNPLECSTFQDCLGRIIQGLLVIAVPVTVVMVIIGAFQMLTAGGDSEKISRGRKTILWAAIGFGILLLAQGLVAVITSILGGGGAE